MKENQLWVKRLSDAGFPNMSDLSLTTLIREFQGITFWKLERVPLNDGSLNTKWLACSVFDHRDTKEPVFDSPEEAVADLWIRRVGSFHSVTKHEMVKS